MKIKVVILLLSLFALTETTQAQVSFGLKGGLNYTKNVFVNEPSGSADSKEFINYKVGYQAGIFGDVQLLEKVSLRPELLFSTKGYKNEYPDDFPVSDATIHLNYINLPLMVSYSIFDKLAILAGPEFGYLLSAKSKIDTETTDLKEVFNNQFDFGLSAGITFAISENINVEIRYTHGLSSVTDDLVFTDENAVPLPNDGSPKFQNRTFQLSTAYRLIK